MVTKEIKDLKEDPDEIVYVAVSCDGTWQERGFQSLNSVFAALTIDTGKVLDVEAMSRTCKPCCLKARHKDQYLVSYAN